MTDDAGARELLTLIDGLTTALGVREEELSIAQAAQARAEQQRDEALGLLRELEWAGANIDTRRQVCPCCDEYPNGDDGGHAPDCALAAALAAQGTEPHADPA